MRRSIRASRALTSPRVTAVSCGGGASAGRLRCATRTATRRSKFACAGVATRMTSNLVCCSNEAFRLRRELHVIPRLPPCLNCHSATSSVPELHGIPRLPPVFFGVELLNYDPSSQPAVSRFHSSVLNLRHCPFVFCFSTTLDS